MKLKLVLAFGTTEAEGGLIVGLSGFLCHVEGAQPLMGLLPGVSDLCRKTAPQPFPNASGFGV